ncbi:hypothetical protein NK6_3869 [Bradyrhizobium diazoefficiens]|uniref:Uncharacterized protein n=1 Tax=Bradyrhizobium diazoefficiens TaxID=1355477 RepID=A0A0E4BPP5_9BRAD|nr:hypothetical protein NK6_3869 [Bradyrhizobium diazoefficiens]
MCPVVTTLTSEYKKAKERPERIAEAAGGPPNGPELEIGQCAACFWVRAEIASLEARKRILAYEFAIGSPVEESR